MASDPILNAPLDQLSEAGEQNKGLVQKTIETTMQTAAALDEKYKVRENVTKSAIAFDEKYPKVKDTAMAGVKKLQEVDERLQVTNNVKAAAKIGTNTVNSAVKLGTETVGTAVKLGGSAVKMGTDTVGSAVKMGTDTVGTAVKMGTDTVQSTKKGVADAAESTKERVLQNVEHAKKTTVETVQQGVKMGVETAQKIDEKYKVRDKVLEFDEKHKISEVTMRTYGSVRDMSLNVYDGVKQRDPTGKLQVVEDMITPYAQGVVSKITNLANTIAGTVSKKPRSQPMSTGITKADVIQDELVVFSKPIDGAVLLGSA